MVEFCGEIFCVMFDLWRNVKCIDKEKKYFFIIIIVCVNNLQPQSEFSVYLRNTKENEKIS